MQIRVNVLNFHSFTKSHIQIILENLSENPSTFYRVDRIAPPDDKFSLSSSHVAYCKRALIKANSSFNFIIEADPSHIIKSWKNYYETATAELINYRDEMIDVSNLVGSLTKNCAHAVEWFLHHFAHVPKTSILNSNRIRMNYVCYGIFFPSFIPFATLPGRVLDNVKEHYKKIDEAKKPGFFTNRNATLIVGAVTSAIVGSESIKRIPL